MEHGQPARNGAMSDVAFGGHGLLIEDFPTVRSSHLEKVLKAIQVVNIHQAPDVAIEKLLFAGLRAGVGRGNGWGDRGDWTQHRPQHRHKSAEHFDSQRRPALALRAGGRV